MREEVALCDLCQPRRTIATGTCSICLKDFCATHSTALQLCVGGVAIDILEACDLCSIRNAEVITPQLRQTVIDAFRTTLAKQALTKGTK